MTTECSPVQPGEITFGRIVIHSLEQKVDDETESLFIAFMHGQFVGSAVAKVQPWKAASIRMLFVSPYRRRAGVATHLITEIEKWAKSQNVERLECVVSKGNDPARQFWIRKAKFIDDTARVIEGAASDYVVMYRELR